jgi:hypothetical protein
LRKPDDCTLTPSQFQKVRLEAFRALKEAGALGVFPTPVADIMSVAKIVEVEDEVLSPSLVDKFRMGVEKVSGTLKRALSKVMGLFHASAGLVFIDRTLLPVRQKFIRLHESAHGFLKWQRPMYAVVEDCEKSLDPDTAELFDREANVFASEILFQLDTFYEMARDEPFSYKTPVGLSKKFDASLYSSIRQYVSKNHRCCAVLVLNPPDLIPGDGFQATLRRIVGSESFTAMFASYPWPAIFTPDDPIGAIVPLGKARASKPRSLPLTDDNGDAHECYAEAFATKWQVFILIQVKAKMRGPGIIMP